jgi:hypothetical protein
MGTWDMDDEDKIDRLNEEITAATQRFNLAEDRLKAKEWEYHTLRRLVYNAMTHHNNDLTHIICENCALFEKMMKEATERRPVDQSNARNAILNKIEKLKSNIRQIENLGGNADAVKKEIDELILQCKIIADSDPHNTELY